ncbi:MAG: serine/threonine protein kinase [bacterium]|nr:serine/threonine protein kinase [bacterium]
MTDSNVSSNTPEGDDLDRLADAVEAYIDRRADDSAASESVDDYLDRHAGLRDLLEPMLDDRPGEPVGGDGCRRLGDYRLGRELGRGGMGVVYEATEESLGRRVALKVLAPALTLSRRQLERFRREAAAAAKLVHPDIVRIHAIGEHDGTHFIAMELIEGRSLRAVMDAVKAKVRGNASRLGSRDMGVTTITGSETATGRYFDEIAELTARLAEALTYSHERGVVHRDVKPQNVIIGDNGRLSLVDFGLAKDLEAESLSLTGDFAGTPQYVSPEQIEAGRAPIDGRSDVFSLGVVLYELLTLTPPFAGNGTRQLMTAIASHEPPSVRARSPQAPRDLETIALKALEKDPRRRYTAAELAIDLRRFLAREPIAARPISTPHKLVRFARRKPATTVAALLAFVLVVIAPIVATIHFKAARDALAIEQQRTLEQRDLARSLLDQARASVATLYARITEFELEAIPHTEGLRLQLLRDASALCDDFLAIANDDPVLRFQAARARTKLARMQRRLSQPRAALASLDAALPLLTAALQSGPVNNHAPLELATLHQMRAHVRLDLNDFDAATESLTAATRWLDAVPLAKLDTGEQRRVRLLRASVLDGRRRHALRRHPSDEAQALATEVVAILEELIDDDRDDLLVARLHAEGVHHLAWVQLARGRLTPAREDFERAKTLFEGLIERQPGVAPFRYWHARTLLGLSGVYRQLGIEGHGRAAQQQAFEQLQSLVQDHPNDPLFRRELLARQLQTAHAQSIRQRSVRTAAIAMVDHFATAEALATRPDADPVDRLQLAKAHRILAQIQYMKIDRDVEKLEGHFTAALGIARELCSAMPDSARYRTELGAILSDRSNWLLNQSQEDPITALPLLEEAISLQRTVIDDAPTYRDARSHLGVHWNLIAILGRKTADPNLLERAANGKVALAPDNQRTQLTAVRLLCEACGFAADANERRRLQTLACGWLARALPEDPAQAQQLLGQKVFAPLADHPDFSRLRERLR